MRGARFILSIISCIAATTTCLLMAACTGTPANFSVVVLTPNTPQIIAQNTTIIITATVTNDSTGAGVTWTLMPPAGEGTLSPTSITAATYNAPASVASAITVTVKATSITNPAQSHSITITVEPPPNITTNSLPGGNYGSPYAGVVNETGGVPPFTWTISAGSLTVGLSPGASITNSVTISGTPQAQTNSNFTIKVTDSTGAFSTQPLTIVIGPPLPLHVTTTSLPNGSLNAAYPSTVLQAAGGVPPFTWTITLGALPPGLTPAANGTISGTPTSTGTFGFTVKVTDSEAIAMTNTANLSITVVNLGLIKGNYAFRFSGFNSGGGVVTGGSFSADGAGHLTNGVEDFNSISVGPKNQTFTGTYTLGADNRGTLVFSSLMGSPTYAFAIDPTGSHGRMIEFDASGVRGSGRIEKQSVNTCVANTITGDYVIGVDGNAIAVQGGSAAGPVALAGRFTATPGSGGAPGTLANGEMDANAPDNPNEGLFPPDSTTVSGTYTTTAQSARCTMTVAPGDLPSMTFSVYPVSAILAFLVETDQANSTTPYLTVGEIDSQVGYPFSGPTAFSGTTVGGLSGQFLSGANYAPEVSVVWMSATGGGTFTMSAWDNRAGSLIEYGISGGGVPQPFSATYSVDTFGRVTSNLVTPFSPIFYVINAGATLCIGNVASNPLLGYFDPQSNGPFSAATIKGTLVEGTKAPGISAVRDISGVITLDGTSVVSGTEDESTSGANTPGETVTGTYQGINSSFGNGTFTLTAPETFDGIFLIVSPTQVVMISNTSGDAHPVLLVLGGN